MMVWIVTEQDYDTYTILGVYNNEQAANNHASALNWKTRWGDVYVEEFDLLDSYVKM